MTKARSMLSLAEDYLAERRRLGFELTISGAQLKAFARFVDESGHTGPLTTEVVLNWVQGRARHATPRAWAVRLDVLRPFAKYLMRLDPLTEFPLTAIFGKSRRRRAPHIYTHQEIVGLLAAARRLGPSGTLRPATYEAMLGLIAAAGLRKSEALHLRCGDLDIHRRVLTIRKTKFRKTRLVPLHTTTVDALKSYLGVRARYGSTRPEAPLFLSSSGGELPQSTVQFVFAKLRDELGLIARGGYDAVRIHDLRHSFICRRVRLWQEQGANIDNAIAALSTYVGHAKISDTYWYLTGVPDLMAVAGKQFELFAEGHHG